AARRSDRGVGPGARPAGVVAERRRVARPAPAPTGRRGPGGAHGLGPGGPRALRHLGLASAPAGHVRDGGPQRGAGGDPRARVAGPGPEPARAPALAAAGVGDGQDADPPSPLTPSPATPDRKPTFEGECMLPAALDPPSR